MKDSAKKHLADRLVSYIVILRDLRCTTCGGSGNLQAGHFFSRGPLNTKWDLRNVYCQCGGCNIEHEHNSEPLRRVLVRAHGEEVLAELERNYNKTAKEHPIDIDVILCKLGVTLLSLCRKRRVTETLTRKVMSGKATNKEVAGFLHGLQNT